LVSFRNAHSEVIVNAVKNARMRGATCRLTYKRGAFQHLQVVAECSAPERVLVTSRHRPACIRQSVSRNGRTRPGLLCRILPGLYQYYRMVEEVGGHQGDHGRLAPRLCAKSKIDCVCVVQRMPSRCCRGRHAEGSGNELSSDTRCCGEGCDLSNVQSCCPRVCDNCARSSAVGSCRFWGRGSRL